MDRQSGSLVLIVMAVMTLAIIMVLPLMSRTNTPEIVPASAPLPEQSALELGRTALIDIAGGTFTRGTTAEEINAAAATCADINETCNPALGLDSMPTHQAQISGFWMEMTEVTYGQYVNFLNTLGANGHLSGCDGQACLLTRAEDTTSSILLDGNTYTTTNPAIDDYPIVGVSWYGAQAYCQSLGRRLPTEAEWEYAARGTTNRLYPWGNEWDYAAANVRGSMVDNEIIIAGAQPVGGNSDYASPEGIRDLAGNVAEWTADWYADDAYSQPYATQPNPTGPDSGEMRVVRGGSWDDPAFFARAVQRQAFTPDTMSASIGFRCAFDG